MSRAPSYTDLALPTETVRIDDSTLLDVQAFGLTDTGLKRSNNEDQFFIGKLQKAIEVIDTSLTTMPAKLKSPFSGNLFIVADGMGGARRRRSCQFVGRPRRRVLHPQYPEVVLLQSPR